MRIGSLAPLAAAALLALPGLAWAQSASIEVDESVKVETLRGAEVPTAIVLEQFAYFADALLSIEDYHGVSPWQQRVLEPLGLAPGSPAALRLESYARSLKRTFEPEWQPSDGARADSKLWQTEQAAFNRAKLGEAARSTAALTASLEKAGPPALQPIEFLDTHIRPEVTAFVVGTPEEWQEGDPTADFLRQWAHFDQELARLTAREETEK